MIQHYIWLLIYVLGAIFVWEAVVAARERKGKPVTWSKSDRIALTLMCLFWPLSVLAVLLMMLFEKESK